MDIVLYFNTLVFISKFVKFFLRTTRQCLFTVSKFQYSVSVWKLSSILVQHYEKRDDGVVSAAANPAVQSAYSYYYVRILLQLFCQ